MNNEPSNNDMLKAENAVLRLQLEMDHGMLESKNFGLSPQLENMWLKSILDFEKKAKGAPRRTVYQHLGKPRFPKAETLSMRDISHQLARLTGLMHTKGVVLDCINNYDDVVIYRFITEELFNAEVFTVPGANMIMHFIYEEFHPPLGE